MASCFTGESSPHGETVPPVLPAVSDCCCCDASSISAAGGAKDDDVAGCDDAKTSTGGSGGARGRTLTAASTRSCGSAEISAHWWGWPVTAGASGGAGATGSLTSGRRTIRKVPSAWLKAMAPVPVSKVQVCQKSSVRTGMFSGTRPNSSLKCLGPNKCSALKDCEGQRKQRQELRAPLASTMYATRLAARSIFSFQCLWDHIFGHLVLSPPGCAGTAAAAPTRIHCPGKDNSCG
mmetsp:Transcript_60065/g.152415  ORF Transcript_60065/g.152415 Transcript_60065/m.152415 type:complete len:235 (+) Transcript_60065:700-1404(+)